MLESAPPKPWGCNCPVCSVTEEPSATHSCALHTLAYLFGSGFGWVLGSFFFLDSFLESFFVSVSAAEALPPSPSALGCDPPSNSAMSWLGGGIEMRGARPAAKAKETRRKHEKPQNKTKGN